MKSSLNGFDRAAFSLLGVFLSAVFLYLFGYSMLYTCSIDTEFIAAEIVQFNQDRLWLNILRVTAGLLICLFVIRLGERLPLKTLIIVSLSLTFALGCAWVLVHRGIPVNDTGILYYTAAEMVRGDPSELWRHEVYLRTNPHQAGYLQYSELLQRIFGRHSTIPQGLLNSLFLTGAYAAVLSLTWQSFHDPSIQRLTALMLLLCLQPVFYTSFLYGNLPGLCAALWAVVFTLHGLKKKRWFAAACVLLCVAVALKPNYLILALALALVLAVYAISTKRLAAVLMAACLLILPAASGKGMQLVLEKRTGFELGSGAPQTVWLAMGMQESSRAPGWYNHYPTDVMEAANCDTAKVQQLVREEIRSRLQVFAANPAYAADFYHKKLVSQWAETTFEIGFTNAVMDNQSAFPDLVDDILTGETSRKLAGFMEGYTLVLYLSFSIGCAWLVSVLLRQTADWRQLLGPLVLLVTILGGFLYHMLFEAKAQYVLFYLPMMIPFAAMGLSRTMAKRS